MSGSAHWSDLAPRVISGLAMALCGFFILWVGGWLFVLGVSLLATLMLWEAARMYNAPNPVGPAILGGVVVCVALTFLPGMLVLPALLAVALVAGSGVAQNRGVVFGFSAWILLGCYAFATFGIWLGLSGLIWLVLVVIASDVAGYFAGRMLGGPKFWPKVSPKKTWSGTVAGWIGAALVGACFMGPLQLGGSFILISVLVAFAGQMGDIVESAVKRHAGVKDSSDLIPGHGGVLDRFDAMLGAGMMAGFLALIGQFSGAS